MFLKTGRPAVFCVLLLTPFTLFAQDSRVAETVEVVGVEVPVSVVDRNGNPVRGLTKENFQLIDDGKRREITYFEAVEIEAPEAAGAKAETPPAAGRQSFLLLFDLSNSRPGNLARAREAAAKFIAGVPAQELVAVGTFSIEHGFRLLTTFTTSRSAVTAAINTLGAPGSFMPSDPLLFTAAQTGTASTDPTRSTGSANEGAKGMAQEMEALSQELARETAKNEKEYFRNRLKTQFENFGAVARMLDRVKGRKQIVLLSEGFDPALVHGREELGSAESRQEALAVEFGEIWAVDTDARYGNVSSRRDLETMAELFRRSDVVLNAIDIRGLRTNVDARTGAVGRTGEGLYLISEPTGGQVFRHANDLDEGFRKILEQRRVSYVLGFQTNATRSGAFRNLKVKLLGVPGARAYHRAGYYDNRNELTELEQTLTASDILMNDLEQDQIRTNLLSVPIPSATAQQNVAVVLEVDGKTLLGSDPAPTQKVEIFVYAFDENNLVQGYLYDSVTLDLAKVGERVSRAGLKYYGTLALAPGKYAVKALVRVRENGRMGFSRVDAAVPEQHAAAVLAPLVFDDVAGDAIMVRATRSSAVEYPFTIGSDSFIPSALPAMRRDRSYRVALFTYNMPLEDLQLQTLVTSAAGESAQVPVALIGRTSPTADGAAKLLFEVRPENLQPGRYTLSFNVRPKNVETVHVASIPFFVD